MPTATDFLRAIEADFDDDLPRLVYADWLEENGEADRAEFIRLQCEAAATEKDKTRADRLNFRAMQLLAKHRRDWTAGLPGWVRRHQFHRGFPHIWLLTGSQLVHDGAKLRTVAPLGGRLALRAIGGMTEDGVFGCEHLAAVTRLELDRDPPTDGIARAMAESPHLGRVTELRFGRSASARYVTPDELTDRAAEVLAGTTALPALTHLHMPGWYRLTAAGVRAILESPCRAGLRRLDLSGTPRPVGDPSIVDGFHTPAAKATALQTLDLDQRRLGDVNAAAVADTPVLQSVVFLSLKWNELTDEGVRELLRSPHLRSLRYLDLSYNPGVTDRTARVILSDDRPGRFVWLVGCSVSTDLVSEVNNRYLAHRREHPD